MYNADGWMFSDEAKTNLPVVDGWNFLMRVYEPKILDLENDKMPTPVRVN